MSMSSIFKNEPVQKINPVLIKRMETIVKQGVVQEKFQSDFYLNDLQAMESCCTFAWYVYDCGTHFIPLNDISAVRAFQREWLSNMKDIKDKKDKDIDRLYVCDVKSGELKRMHYCEEGNLVDQLKKVV